MENTIARKTAKNNKSRAHHQKRLVQVTLRIPPAYYSRMMKAQKMSGFKCRNTFIGLAIMATVERYEKKHQAAPAAPVAALASAVYPLRHQAAPAPQTEQPARWTADMVSKLIQTNGNLIAAVCSQAKVCLGEAELKTRDMNKMIARSQAVMDKADACITRRKEAAGRPQLQLLS